MAILKPSPGLPIIADRHAPGQEAGQQRWARDRLEPLGVVEPLASAGTRMPRNAARPALAGTGENDAWVKAIAIRYRGLLAAKHVVVTITRGSHVPCWRRPGPSTSSRTAQTEIASPVRSPRQALLVLGEPNRLVARCRAPAWRRRSQPARHAVPASRA